MTSGNRALMLMLAIVVNVISMLVNQGHPVLTHVNAVLVGACAALLLVILRDAE